MTFRYEVRVAEQPVVDQGDPTDAHWIAAGGDPRDRGRFVEVVSGRLSGSKRTMVGVGWLEPGEVHLLHHHPHADDWYYVIEGSALFTVGDDVIRGTPGTALFLPPACRTASTTTARGDCRSHGASIAPSSRRVGIVWDE